MNGFLSESVRKNLPLFYFKAIEKLTVLGGRHFLSSQVWYSSFPVTFVFALPFIFTRCTKSTLLLYWLAEMSSFSSLYFSSLPSSFTFPSKFSSGLLLKSKVVGCAMASSGCDCEYRCQPG